MNHDSEAKMAKDDDYRQQAMLELFKTDLQHHEGLTSAVVAMTQGALRVVVLLNGGAIIALLSIYGVDNAPKMPEWALGVAAAAWLVGLAAGAFATGWATREQREFQAHAGNEFRRRARSFFKLPIPETEDSQEPHVDRGYCFRAASVWAWRVSTVAFIIGAAVAVCGLVFFANVGSVSPSA